MTIRFHQDFDAGAVDATLFALVGTSTCIEIRPDNSCTTAANPSYSGLAVLSQYPPQGGAVGTLMDAQAEFMAASDLTRASSS